MSRIYFREEGSGTPLVFLHGFCDSHNLWMDFVRAFTSSYRVLTPDLPGFGQSHILPAPFSIDQVGDELSDWMKELGVERPIVIGHSLGGYVALSLLERHREQLSGIVLFHSTPFADSEERKKIREKVIEFVELNGVEPFIETFVPGLFADKLSPQVSVTRQRALATKKQALIGYARAMRDRPDRSETVIQETLPVLIIAGALDSLIPIEDLRKFVKMAPKCLFLELPEAGHMGIFEAKKQCQAIISEFAASERPNKEI